MERLRYPGMRYRAGGEWCIVDSADEDEALGDEWTDNPRTMEEEPPDVTVEEPSQPTPQSRKRGRPRLRK